ncbi:GTPase-activating protein, partial [Chytridiales sp. JEL 0842]
MIQLQNVSFDYPQRPGVSVLGSINLQLGVGKKIALVGASGSGKSTILKLIQRFYDPTSGNVFWDNINVKDLNVHWLRSQFGIVDQEPVLFDMSIKDNILCGLTEPLETFTEKELTEKVKEACKLANIWEFVENLPKGMDTSAGEAGTMLSGGQKQRIAIARAIIKKPKILLLDEATSALDTESERIIQDTFNISLPNLTIIFIAHRLSTVIHADNIIGHVVEEGNFNELAAKEGHFGALIAAQKLKRNRSISTLVAEEDRPVVPLTEIGLPIEKHEKKETSTDFLINMESRAEPPKIRELSKLVETELTEAEAELIKKPINMGLLLSLSKNEWWILLIGAILSLANGVIFPIFSVVFSGVLNDLGNPDSVERNKRVTYWAL